MAVESPPTTMLDRIERISAEAREIHLARTLLILVAALFYALGFVAAKVCVAIWLVVSWSIAAIKVGWVDAFQRRHR